MSIQYNPMIAALPSQNLLPLPLLPFKSGTEGLPFNIGDYWLIIIYCCTLRSWKLLREVTKHIRFSPCKLHHINELERKLKVLGYYTYPEKLLKHYGYPSDIEVLQAINWFFDSDSVSYN